MKAGAKAAGKEMITTDDFLAMMEEAVEGVKMRVKPSGARRPCWIP